MKTITPETVSLPAAGRTLASITPEAPGFQIRWTSEHDNTEHVYHPPAASDFVEVK